MLLAGALAGSLGVQGGARAISSNGIWDSPSCWDTTPLLGTGLQGPWRLGMVPGVGASPMGPRRKVPGMWAQV